MFFFLFTIFHFRYYRCYLLNCDFVAAVAACLIAVVIGFFFSLLFCFISGSLSKAHCTQFYLLCHLNINIIAKILYFICFIFYFIWTFYSFLHIEPFVLSFCFAIYSDLCSVSLSLFSDCFIYFFYCQWWYFWCCCSASHYEIYVYCSKLFEFEIQMNPHCVSCSARATVVAEWRKHPNI